VQLFLLSCHPSPGANLQYQKVLSSNAKSSVPCI
jgi:hypothetical protein